MDARATLILLVLSGCCLDGYKHDANRQLELYKKCSENDNHYTATYCENIAEAGSRIGSCND